MSVKDFIEKSKWIEGPEFLNKSEDKWLDEEQLLGSSDQPLPEEKNVRVNTQVFNKRRTVAYSID
jgi:hypothetical protein